MIQSAQVFSPRPSADPAVNLKVLQTPLNLRARERSRSPVKGEKASLMDRLQEAAGDVQGGGDGEEPETEEVVLVDGNHPRVVQEEKDLVILEDVPYSPPPSPPPPTPQFPSSSPRTQPQTARSLLNAFPSIPHSPPLPPLPDSQTSPPLLQSLRRPPLPTKASLHKAVLIRSAQRALMRAEAEAAKGDYSDEAEAGDDSDREEDGEEEEEREVEAVAIAESESDDHDDDEEESKDAEGEGKENGKETKSMWRKSWKNLVGFVRSGSVSHEEEEEDGGEDEDGDGEDEMDVDEEVRRSICFLCSFPCFYFISYYYAHILTSRDSRRTTSQTCYPPTTQPHQLLVMLHPNPTRYVASALPLSLCYIIKQINILARDSRPTTCQTRLSNTPQ
jgi:hypothetical protein